MILHKHHKPLPSTIVCKLGLYILFEDISRVPCRFTLFCRLYPTNVQGASPYSFRIPLVCIYISFRFMLLNIWLSFLTELTSMSSCSSKYHWIVIVWAHIFYMYIFYMYWILYIVLLCCIFWYAFNTHFFCALLILFFSLCHKRMINSLP